MVFKLIYKQDLDDIYRELKKLLKQLITFSLFYKKFLKMGY